MDEPDILRLPPYFTIDLDERMNVHKALKSPLSGYLGGIDKAGYYVTRLQDKWREAFGVKHAIACNSATSGLLAACMAIGIGPGDEVWTTAYSMSATAACAKVLGARIVFIDIETTRFSLDIASVPTGPMPKCIIVTNLFGHPAHLTRIRSWCDSNKVLMIEDAAQSPFATEDGKYAGTIGHIGVFSLNVHKHVQCGEGGVIVTNDDALCAALAGAINHGELSGNANCRAGLNLRMTEPVAAIAVAQLARAKDLILSRINLANELTHMFRGIPWIKPRVPDEGCWDVYYIWSALVEGIIPRDNFVINLRLRGFPMRLGYTSPLHRVFNTKQNLPVVQEIEYHKIITFEVCSWDPSRAHIQRMKEIVNEVGGDLS